MHFAQRLKCAGAGLLDLPKEILQSVARHLDAVQWAKGPSRTCHQLCQLPLTRIVMPQQVGPTHPSGGPICEVCAEHPNYIDSQFSLLLHPVQAAGGRKSLSSENADPATDRAASIQRTVSSLTWLAKRTGAATTSLALALTLHGPCAGAAAAKCTSLPSALSEAKLSNLRCLEFSSGADFDPALYELLDWLLQRAPKLEATSLCMSTQHLPAYHITFQHMRHLVMTFSAIQWHQGPSLVAQHLPALETLRVNTCGVLGQGAIDTSGCKRLRQLVVSDPVPQQLIWDTGSGPCPVAFELLNRNIYSCNGISYALKKQAGLPQHVIIDAQYHPYCADWTIRAVHGLLGAFSSMRVLTWKWAVHYNYYKARRPDEDEFHENADQYFASCMPLAGMPLVNLETIIITAHSMQWTFPRTCQLPNLRQLVVKASGRLQIEFREPIGTLLKLSSMHVFERPYHPHGCDQLGLTEGASALAERGLVLGMASTEQHGCSGRPASCVYLRPVGTRELSIDELWTTVEQLAHCRCGACFDCLRRAGCIEG